jgi:hypothetical protein
MLEVRVLPGEPDFADRLRPYVLRLLGRYAWQAILGFLFLPFRVRDTGRRDLVPAPDMRGGAG